MNAVDFEIPVDKEFYDSRRRASKSLIILDLDQWYYMKLRGLGK